MKWIIPLLTFALAVTASAPQAQAEGGVPLWTNRFNRPGSGDAYPVAIAVDRSGNVCIAGCATNNYTGYDYLTLRYSNEGAPLWTNYYNGPGNGDDYASAIAVDNKGNVIVAGWSTGNDSNYDYATIKYSKTGAPLWTNRYSGPVTGGDWATAVAVNDSGAVFVTGESTGIGGASDFATIAYSSAGLPLWTNRYNHTGTNFSYASSAAVSSGGTVFVTGYYGGGFDYGSATIAYSGGGAPLWTNAYFRGSDGVLAVDTNGNVFVAGPKDSQFGVGLDLMTVKFSGAGAPLWTNRYGLWNGSGNGFSVRNQIALDVGGNVVVSDPSLLSGVGGYDYATIKYSNAGLPLWTNRYNGPENNDDWAAAMAVDTRGDVFVTGYSTNQGTGNDYATIAYSALGVPLWTNWYSGPGNGDDSGYAMATDGSGNVFVTGWSWNGSNYDIATIKYSSSVPSTLQPIPLSIQKYSQFAVLSWSNPAFGLQAAPAASATFTNLSGATSPYTNFFSGTQQFFRLIAN
jgi:hypothetical protein